jgi:hypothetical protein
VWYCAPVIPAPQQKKRRRKREKHLQRNPVRLGQPLRSDTIKAKAKIVVLAVKKSHFKDMYPRIA